MRELEANKNMKSILAALVLALSVSACGALKVKPASAPPVVTDEGLGAGSGE
jgi:hypothetical protein